jgi:hypothetical protein
LITPNSIWLLAWFLIIYSCSWNRDLANDRGTYMGKGYRKKGVNMILGPVVGPLGRVALGGRNWEGFSTDPYLSGILVSESVKGLQSQKVATSLKVCLSLSSITCESNTRVALHRQRTRNKPQPNHGLGRQCHSVSLFQH